MDGVEIFGLLFIIAIILVGIYAFFVYNPNSDKGGGDQDTDNNYIVVGAPDSRLNAFLVLSDGKNIDFTSDSNKATKVSIAQDDVGNALNKDTFPIYKIMVKGQYVNIQSKNSNVNNPDDNIISYSNDFYFNKSESTPEASLFLDVNGFLSAYFVFKPTAYDYVASSIDDGSDNANITFNTAVDDSDPNSANQLIVQPVQINS